MLLCICGSCLECFSRVSGAGQRKAMRGQGTAGQVKALGFAFAALAGNVFGELPGWGRAEQGIARQGRARQRKARQCKDRAQQAKERLWV